MNRPHGNSATRSEELVNLLVLLEGFDDATARRLVDVTVEDLVRSIHRQDGIRRLGGSGMAEGRRLLDFVHGDAIASAVGIPAPRAWQALRTLAPHLLPVARDAIAPRGTAGPTRNEQGDEPDDRSHSYRLLSD